ncbi:TVP38/TMEM64 family protein [filamentous cyanobacterium CCP5]|nr:TVP38/TMEM64 family protein [filamentous cyanobacterium CCP5]
MALGPWQEVAFITAHVVATAVAVPGTVLVVAGGVLFGVVWGTVWSVVGATLGAIAAFAIARYGLREQCRRWFKHQTILNQIDHHLQRQAFWYVLAVRFAPISPFNLINFLFGLTSVRLKTYVLGTSVGIIPGTAAYTWIGAAGFNAFKRGEWLPLILALLALTGLSLIPVVIRHRRGGNKLSLRRSSRNSHR